MLIIVFILMIFMYSVAGTMESGLRNAFRGAMYVLVSRPFTGLLLSVLVGLSYWGYAGATYYAIGREADRFVLGYMDDVANGRVLSAFRRTLPPAERPPEGGNLRANGNHLPENLYLVRATLDGKTPRSRCLKTYKDDRIPRVGQSLDQMVLDAAAGQDKTLVGEIRVSIGPAIKVSVAGREG